MLLADILSAGVASANADRLTTVSTPQPELLFGENRVQFKESVDFAAYGRGYAVFLGQASVVELFRYADEPAPCRA